MSRKQKPSETKDTSKKHVKGGVGEVGGAKIIILYIKMHCYQSVAGKNSGYFVLWTLLQTEIYGIIMTYEFLYDYELDLAVIRL